MNIEKYLVLNKYLLSLFGIIDFKDLQGKSKDVDTGYDSDGRSYFVNVLRSLEGLNKDALSENTLLRYDENIQSYVRKINYRREPVSLKYFQYLAILLTEIILDNLKNRKIEFLYEVNDFLRTYSQDQDIELLDEFTEEDFKKLAFWMATGSGKTLIMHINYHQFFYYKLFTPDNIILITPNEGLSRQHYEELQKSGIPCNLYGGSLSSLGITIGSQEILVLEMTKLVEEKKGGGVTLPVDVFEGKNLVFVDEGHKGKKSEEQKWAKLRDKLAEEGFVFEYSATFGQILSEGNKETLKEYAKSIIFDYSYKYFYLDGYGKDFAVLNVKDTKVPDKEFQEIMFIANLLSFYEQILAYGESKGLAIEHNLEKPLWIFVGTTVTGKEEESDVIQIVEFLKRAIQHEKWCSKKVKDLLEGKTGLKNDNDEDVFENKFGYLKSRSFSFDNLYKKVFGGKGSFSVHELKNAEGELGLKVGENDYFGVVNIGDVSGFKKELEKKGISVGQDAVSGSLFDAIKKEGAQINILIGSKKFIEGWDTWRVSSMGLLNIGKGQGPQIIQLFGRGVRLKGKGMTLKRSGEKTSVQFLEMLNIYGIKADYLNKFLEAIRKEEVEFETIEIPVKPQYEEKWKTLHTLAKNENKWFEEDEILQLQIDNQIHFTLDLLPKVSVYVAKERKEGEEGIKTEELKAEVEGVILSEDIIELLDWEKIWNEIYYFKIAKGYWNLILNRYKLKALLLSDRYRILALPQVLEPRHEEDIRRIEEIAILIIRKYLDLFYRKYAKRFETKHMQYETVTPKQLKLFISESGDQYSYTVHIKKTDEKGKPINKDLIRKIKELAKNLDELTKKESDELPRVYFDKHLYLPILLQSNKIEKISPAGLEKSEKKFVKDMKEYLKINQEKFKKYEIYLLRNFPKSGVGFFNLSGFYPDFIMWLKHGSKQTIIFIDPKGLQHTKGLDDQKITLSYDIKGLEKSLGKANIILESFIISDTPYNKLIAGRTCPEPKEEYINKHVLFLDDKDWTEQFFNKLL
ncbi:MAG: DEAD/DEAH box helicase family protein [Nitrospirota bacterium]